MSSMRSMAPSLHRLARFGKESTRTRLPRPWLLWAALAWAVVVLRLTLCGPAQAAFDAHREEVAPLASDVGSRRERDALVVPR
mmetsp:Transcript_67001/g.180116  ORF Transcript_67001/g.180116 Transcript_67001/m.180116 type:complete len:83 (+) Transcript_67001:20-268(+)